MSLSRCVSSSLRTRQALHRVVFPVAAVANSGVKVDGRAGVCIAPVQSPVLAVREYSKRASARRQTRSSSSSDSSDSDRGVGKRKGNKHVVRAQTPFWRQKMRTHHTLLDVNKDGVVSWDDFEALIGRFKELGHLTPKEVGKLTNALRHVWEEEWGASGDPYIFIGQEQFLSQMEHVVNTKELRKKVASPLQYFFKAVDTDGSGEISVEEFKMFYACLGLSEEAAAESFAAIDINGDGKLSMKEFIKLGREFFLSEDDTRPSKLFWGPISE